MRVMGEAFGLVGGASGPERNHPMGQATGSISVSKVPFSWLDKQNCPYFIEFR